MASVTLLPPIRLRAARKLTGTAKMTPITVDRKARAIVSPIFSMTNDRVCVGCSAPLGMSCTARTAWVSVSPGPGWAVRGTAWGTVRVA